MSWQTLKTCIGFSEDIYVQFAFWAHSSGRCCIVNLELPFILHNLNHLRRYGRILFLDFTSTFIITNTNMLHHKLNKLIVSPSTWQHLDWLAAAAETAEHYLPHKNTPHSPHSAFLFTQMIAPQRTYLWNSWSSHRTLLFWSDPWQVSIKTGGESTDPLVQSESRGA